VRRARLWYVALLGHGLAVTILGSIKPKYFRFNGEKVGFLPRYGAEPADLLGGLRPQVRLDPETGRSYLMTASGPDPARPAVLLLAYFGSTRTSCATWGRASSWPAQGGQILGTVLIAAGLFLLGFRSHSRAVLVIDWMLLVVVLYGYRLALKVQAEKRARPRIPALIVGAHDTASSWPASSFAIRGFPILPSASSTTT
jgi:hypothetical protein